MRHFGLALTSLLLAGTAVATAQPRSGAATPAPATATAGEPDGLPGRRAPTRAANQPRYGMFGIDLAARDTAVKPGDDFNLHANGAWLRAVEIPADRTGWDLWTALSEDIEQQVKAIVDDASAGRAGNSPAARQIGAYYAGWMDEAGIERRGIAPLRPYLQRIDAVTNRDQLITLFATPGYASPVGVGVIPNFADPTRYVAIAAQGTLGMPRDNYLRDDETHARYRTEYRKMMVELYRLAGISDAEARADRVIALERQMAQVHWEPAQMRNLPAMNNPMNRAQLTELAPQFNWNDYLQRRGLQNQEIVIAATKEPIKNIGLLMDSVPLQTWKDYMTFHLLRSTASFLPKAFDDAQFNFYGRTLGGQQAQRERWKRGISGVNGVLGEAVGQVYVERHFPAESKRQMDELIVNLRAAFTERLQNLAWMDDATRREALAKLEAFKPQIGYPEIWTDYSSLRIDPADPLGNAMRAGEFQWNLQLSRLPNPVDRRLWAMNPQTINAYYSPLANQITFPAGILQPPFFDPKADPAVNYGAIGAVIGHEIGHGFDDNGRRFDGTGTMRDWWTPTAAERFQEQTRRLGAQYEQFEPLPGLKINPQLTMGENIGDLGGLEMAYAAYRRHVAQHGEPPVINGLTGDQRFFLSWAQVWRNKLRDDTMRNRVATDSHSPAAYRINGVVRNMDAWYRAFNVQPGDRLYLAPADRVRIW